MEKLFETPLSACAVDGAIGPPNRHVQHACALVLRAALPRHQFFMPSMGYTSSLGQPSDP
eukprot:10613807-Lingulodinium_polyedra.AAC.1